MPESDSNSTSPFDFVSVTEEVPLYADRWRRSAATAVRDMATGRTWALPTDGSGILGASRSAHVLIPDPGVSRRHVTLGRQSDGRWMLRDNSSTNGTFVFGHRVIDIVVQVGDIIQVGPTRLLFVDDAMLAAAPVLDVFLDRALPGADDSTSHALARIAYAPQALLLAGPHRDALRFLAGELVRLAAPRARLVDLADAAASKLLKCVGSEDAVAIVGDLTRDHPHRRTLLDAMTPTAADASWALGLSTDPRDYAPAAERRWPARYRLRVPPISDLADGRTELAARIYAARADLHAFVDPETLVGIVRHPSIVDVSKAWDAVAWLAVFNQVGGNVAAAAARLGVSRTTLSSWVQRHGVRTSTSSVGDSHDGALRGPPWLRRPDGA